MSTDRQAVPLSPLPPFVTPAEAQDDIDVPAPASSARSAARLLASALVAVPIAAIGILTAVAALNGRNLLSSLPGTSVPARVAELAEGAIAGLAAYLVVLVVLAFVSRPRRVAPESPTPELGDDPIPPALAGFLVNAWATPTEAVQGTLVDLAARRILTLRDAQRGHTVVQLSDGVDTAELTPYERRVLDHVRSLAAGGVVPGEALATWPYHDAERWFKSFCVEVVADARSRGLSRRRWPAWAHLILLVIAILPSVLATLAVKAAPALTHQSDNGDIALAVGVLTWIVLSGLPGLARQQRDTPRGRRAAAHWLGVRRYLHADRVFPTLPPAAVAIWNRYLAYGAALGVAAEAARQLPFGAEDPHRAWSSVGGRWRTVAVHYPRFRPGWGSSPWRLLGKGLRTIGFALLPWAAIWIADRLTGRASGRRSIFSAIISAIPDQFQWTVAAAVLVTLGAVAYGVMFLVLAAMDAGRGRSVSGRILRMHAVNMGRDERTQYYWIAVDEGTRRRIDAWRAAPAFAHSGQVNEQVDVDAVVSPVCGYVRSLDEIIAPPAPRPQAASSA
jgi:hypothetical protein